MKFRYETPMGMYLLRRRYLTCDTALCVGLATYRGTETPWSTFTDPKAAP